MHFLSDEEPERSSMKRFCENLGSNRASDPMFLSDAMQKRAAAELIDSVAVIERHLLSAAYGVDLPDCKVAIRGVPWKSAEDILHEINASSAAVSAASPLDPRDNSAVTAVLNASNPRELVERLKKVVERPHTLLDPWKHIKGYRHKARPGFASDEEVGNCNAALSQIYHVLETILGVAVHREHGAVHFYVYGYENAGECVDVDSGSHQCDRSCAVCPVTRQINAQLCHYGMQCLPNQLYPRDALPISS